MFVRCSTTSPRMDSVVGCREGAGCLILFGTRAEDHVPHQCSVVGWDRERHPSLDGGSGCSCMPSVGWLFHYLPSPVLLPSIFPSLHPSIHPVLSTCFPVSSLSASCDAAGHPEQQPIRTLQIAQLIPKRQLGACFPEQRACPPGKTYPAAAWLRYPLHARCPVTSHHRPPPDSKRDTAPRPIPKPHTPNPPSPAGRTSTPSLPVRNISPSRIPSHLYTTAKMMRAQLEQSQQRRPQPDQGGATNAARGGTSSSSASAPAPSGLPNLQSAAAESDSPYVRRHADTPVAWRALDEDTLARAAAENKPIFMHIGFLADHRELPPPESPPIAPDR